jgi:hypothetical protein
MAWKPLPVEEEIRQCETLRDKLKEHGLGHYVRIAGEEERSYARRRFREALASHIEKLRGGINGGTIAGESVGGDSGVAS